MSPRDVLGLLRPRLPRLALAVLFGTLALGSALALATVSAWLITRAWQMPPVLDLSVAVVAVRALGISRGVFSYCERLAIHDVALRSAGHARAGLYRRLTQLPQDTALRLHSGELVARLGSSVDELADVLVRAVLPICVAVLLSAAGITIIGLISPAAAAVLAGCLLVAGCWRRGWRPRRRTPPNSSPPTSTALAIPPPSSPWNTPPNCGCAAGSLR